MTIIDFNTANLVAPRQHDADRVVRIKSHIESRAPAVLAYLLPGGVIRGNEFVCGDISGARGESLCISLKTGKIGTGQDFATGELFGDLIEVWKAARRVPFAKALEEIEAWLGAPTEKLPQHYRSTSQGIPVKTWSYLDLDGSIISTVTRYDLGDGKKEFRPWDAKNKKSAFPIPRPLYNLPSIAISDTVIFVEGEKAADALIQFGYCTTTAMGGSNTATDKTDWKPLAGKNIIMWPDNDRAGAIYASNVIKAAKAAKAKSIRTVQIPAGMPEKWDAADAVKELTKSDIDSLLNSASVPEQSDKPSLPLIWFNSIETCTDTTDFVESFLGEEGMSVLFGESNCGKTFYASNLACHVAMGKPWFGLEVEKGGVIYVAAEGGFGIRNRLAAFRQHYQLGNVQLPLAIVPASIDLLDPNADVQRLIDLILEAAKSIGTAIKMVVIDTLARVLAGGNENAPDDMGALVRSADIIRQICHIHVMFIHHSGKDTARGARGHSSLRAATDTEIEITRDPETKTATVTVTKQRDFEYLEPHHFNLKSVELGKNKRGKSITSCIVEKANPDLNAKQNIKLSDLEFKALTEIKNLINEDFIKPVIPLSGMSPVRAATRMQVRDWFVARWVIDVENPKNWTSTERSNFFRLIRNLEKKNQIVVHNDFIWMINQNARVSSALHDEDEDQVIENI